MAQVQFVVWPKRVSQFILLIFGHPDQLGCVAGVVGSPGTLAVRIHRELAVMGYDGGITILRDFMVPHRPVYRAKVTPRFETEPGRQAQVDVGHFTYRGLEGRLRKTYCLAAVLGYSRMLYVEFIPRPGQMEILKAIRNAFDYLGGVPRPRAGRWSEACRAYWARVKGKVERPIRYIRDDPFKERKTDGVGSS
jgi:transposase